MTKRQQHNKQEAGEIVLADVNETVEAEVENVPEQQVVRPGSQIAALRQAKHLSIEDVSAFLKLAPKQVAAIENDDYASLPGMVITRGFVKSYAKMLGADPAPYLAALPEAKMPEQDTTPSPRIDAKPFEMNWPLRRHSFMPKILTALVIIAVVGGIASYTVNKMGGLSAAEDSLKQAELPGQAKTADDSAQTPSSSTETLFDKFNNTSSVAAAPSAESSKTAVGNDQSKASAQADNAKEVPAVQADVTQPAQTNSLPAPAAVAAPAPAPVAPAAVPAASAANGSNALQLSASKNSWVEARKVSDNSIVFSKLMHAGDTATINVGEPVQLVIGDVAAISATLRGTPYTFSDVKNNVARTTVK